jgi:hypothetical protein
MILYPEHPVDFHELGHELSATYLRVWSLLTASLCWQCIIGVALGVSLFGGPVRFAERYGLLLGVLRLLWLLVSIVLSMTWPTIQYTLVFSVLYSTTQLMVVSMTFRHTVGTLALFVDLHIRTIYIYIYVYIYIYIFVNIYIIFWYIYLHKHTHTLSA